MRRSPSHNSQQPARLLNVLLLEDRTSPSVVPVGGEFRVNTYTPNNQWKPSVAVDHAGDFVVAWYGYGQGSTINSPQIYAQRYDSAGVPQGGEFRVNTDSTALKANPSVAMDQAGDFVVAWGSLGQPNSWGVYAQRFNSVGIPQGGEFRVNTYAGGSALYPSIAMDQDGDFVVTWVNGGQDGSNDGIYAQRYNSSGLPQGGEFQVNAYTTGSQREPRAAMDRDGDFVVTWMSYGQDGSDAGVYAQRYNAVGQPQGSEFRVNTYSTDRQGYPSVAMDQPGEFVVAWNSYGQDGVYAKRYDSAGVPQGGEVLVSTGGFPSVAMDQTGNFVIALSGFAGEDGDGSGVVARAFLASGVPDGGEFRVNTYTTDDQRFQAVAMNHFGDFIVAWQSQGNNGVGQDGEASGVYAQRYKLTEPLQISAAQINNGAAQRSRVTSLAVTFSAQVTFATTPAAAFTLTRNSDGAAVGFTANVGVVAGVTVVTLNNFSGVATQFGSLADGRYTLTALASQVSANAQQMASDYTFGDAQGLYRFYGDINGDRRVDIADFGYFSLAFFNPPNYNYALDFNGDGRIDIADFGQFSVRYFTNLP